MKNWSFRVMFSFFICGYLLAYSLLSIFRSIVSQIFCIALCLPYVTYIYKGNFVLNGKKAEKLGKHNRAKCLMKL